MLAPVSHILPLTTIHRERLLPAPGRVTVRKGQKVNPTEVVAEANLAPEHLLLDVARGLGLPRNRADKAIHRRVGEEVSAGDVIAGPVGLTRRVVRASRAGKVMLVGNGQVLLEVESPHFELRAGMPGVVSAVMPERGVAIENTGALIQGVWGNGEVDFGLLHVQLRDPQDILTTNGLDLSLRGSVILAGHCEEEAVLRTAADLPVRGLILSSMASALVPLATQLRFPIVVVEGFGRLPMSAPAYKLLATSERREVTLNAALPSRLAGVRPEIIIPLPVESAPAPPDEVVYFTSEQRVRVVRAPHQTQSGVLVTLLPGLHVFPNGVRAPAAEVRLESSENVTLPLANLEVLK